MAQEVAQPREMAINKALMSHGTEIKPGVVQEGEVSKEPQVVEKFGGPCRGRTYGPLIKSPAEDLTQDTQQGESSAKGEDS